MDTPVPSGNTAVHEKPNGQSHTHLTYEKLDILHQKEENNRLTLMI